jgi:hypothetical protein
MLGIARVLGMEGHTNWDAFTYLGTPIFKATPRANQWKHLIDKLKKKISNWGVTWLNLAGKVVLINQCWPVYPYTRVQCSWPLAPQYKKSKLCKDTSFGKEGNRPEGNCI